MGVRGRDKGRGRGRASLTWSPKKTYSERMQTADETRTYMPVARLGLDRGLGLGRGQGVITTAWRHL